MRCEYTVRVPQRCVHHGQYESVEILSRNTFATIFFKKISAAVQRRKRWYRAVISHWNLIAFRAKLSHAPAENLSSDIFGSMFVKLHGRVRTHKFQDSVSVPRK